MSIGMRLGRDVTGIHIVYILLVALRIALASPALGIGAAFAIDYFYGRMLTDTSVAAFGIADNAPVLSLFSLESPLLFIITGSIFIISITASVQTLFRDVLYSPIHDIRDE